MVVSDEVDSRELTNIGTKTCAATAQSDQRTLTTTGSTRAKVAVLGVPCVSDDVVDRLAAHQSVWHRGLAEKNCAHLSEFLDQLTLEIALFSSPFETLEVANPAYIAHVSIHTDGSQ
jgi:hypothetical protein